MDLLFKTIVIALAVFSAGSISNAYGLNCGGKAFHCLNSTHFLICVKTVSGVSATVDDMAMECPAPTECRNYNNFECEMPVPIISQTPLPSVFETTTVNDSELLTTKTPFSTNEITTENIYGTNETQTLENLSAVNPNITVIWMDTTEITTKQNYNNEANYVTTESINTLEDGNHDYTTYPIKNETSSSSSTPLTTVAHNNIITINDTTTLVYDQTSTIENEVTSDSQDMNNFNTGPAFVNVSFSTESVTITSDYTVTEKPQNITVTVNSTFTESNNTDSSTVEITLENENAASTQQFVPDTSFTTESTITNPDSLYTSPLDTWHKPSTLSDVTQKSETEVFDEVTLSTARESNIISTDDITDIYKDVTPGGELFASSTASSAIIEEETSSFPFEWNTINEVTVDNYRQNDTSNNNNEAVYQPTVVAETTSATDINVVQEVMSTPDELIVENITEDIFTSTSVGVIAEMTTSSQDGQNVEIVTDASVNINKTDHNVIEGLDGYVTTAMPNSSETQISNIEDVSNSSSGGNWIIDTTTEISIELNQNSTTTSDNVAVSQISTSTTLAESTANSNIDIVEELTSSPSGEWNLGITTELAVDILNQDNTTDSSIIVGQSTNLAENTSIGTSVDMVEEVTSVSEGHQNIEINTNASVNMNQTDHNITEGLDGHITPAMPNSSGTHVSNIEDVTTSSSGGNWIIDNTTGISVELNQNSTTTSDNVTVSQIFTSTTLAESTSGSSIDIVEELTSSPSGEWNLGITTELTVDILIKDNTTDSSIMEGQSTNLAENISIGTSVDMVEEVTSSSQSEQNVGIVTDATVNMNQTDHNVTEGLDGYVTTAMPNSSETHVSNIEDVTTSSSGGNWIMDSTTGISVELNQYSTTTSNNVAVSQISTSTTLAESTAGSNIDIVEELTSSPSGEWNLGITTELTVDILNQDNTTDSSSIMEGQGTNLAENTSIGTSVDMVEEVTSSSQSDQNIEIVTDASVNINKTDHNVIEGLDGYVTTAMPNSSETQVSNIEDVSNSSSGGNWIIDTTTEISIELNQNSTTTSDNVAVSQISTSTTLAESTANSNIDIVEELTSSPSGEWNLGITTELAVDILNQDNTTDSSIIVGQSTNLAENTLIGTSVDMVEEVTSVSEGHQNIEINTNASVNMNQTDHNITEGLDGHITPAMPNFSGTHVSNIEDVTTSSSGGNWIIDTTTRISVELNQNSTTTSDNVTVSQISTSTTLAESTSGSSIDIVEELTSSPSGEWNLGITTELTVDILIKDNTTDSSIMEGQSTNLAENISIGTSVDMVEEVTSSSQSDQNIEINTNASLNMNQTDHHVTEGLDGYVTTAMPNSSETHVSNIEDVTTSSSGGNWIMDSTTGISVELNQYSTTTSNNVVVSQISTSTILAESTAGSNIDIVEELTSSPSGQWNLGITTELTVDILNQDNTTGSSSIMEGQGTNLADNTSIGTSVDMVEEVTSSSQSDQNIEINTNASLNMNQTDHNITEGLDGHIAPAMPNSSETHVSNIEDVTTSSSGGNWIIDSTTGIFVELNQNSTTTSDNVAVSQISTSTTLAESTSGSNIDFVEEITSSPSGEWNLGITTELTVDILNEDNTTDSSIMEGQGTNLAENTSIGTSVDMVEEVTSSSQGEQNVGIVTDATVNMNQTDHSVTEGLDGYVTTAMQNYSETHVSNIEDVTTSSSSGNWIIDSTTGISVELNQNSTTTSNNVAVSQISTSTTLAESTGGSNIDIVEELTSSPSGEWNVGITTELTLDILNQDNTTDSSIMEGQGTNLAENTSIGTSVDMVEEVTSSSQSDQNIEINTNASLNMNQTDHNITEGLDGHITPAMPNSSETHVSNIENVTTSSSGGNWIIDTTTGISVELNQNSTTTSDNVAVSQISTSTTLAESTSGSNIDIVEEITSSPSGEWNLGITTEFTVHILNEDNTTDSSIMEGQGTNLAENTSIGTSVDMVEEVTSSSQGEQNVGIDTDATVNMNQTDHNMTEGLDGHITPAMPNSSETHVSNIEDVTTSSSGGNWIIDSTTGISVELNQNSTTTSNNVAVSQISTSTTLAESTAGSNIDIVEELTSLPSGEWNLGITTELTVDILNQDNTTDSSIMEGQGTNLAENNSIGTSVDMVEEVTSSSQGEQNVGIVTDATVNMNQTDHNITEGLDGHITPAMPNSSETHVSNIEDVTTSSSGGNWIIDSTTGISVELNQNSTTTSNNVAVSQISTSTTLAESTAGSNIDIVEILTSSPSGEWNLGITTELTEDILNQDNTTDSSIMEGQGTNLAENTSIGTSVDMVEEVTSSSQGEQNVGIVADATENMNQTDHNVTEGLDGHITSAMPNSSETHVSNIEDVTTFSSGGNWIIDTTTGIFVELNQNSTTTSDNVAVNQISTSTTLAESTSGSNIDIVEEITSSPSGEWNLGITTELTVDILNEDNTTDSSIMEGQGTNLAENTSIGTSVDMVEEVTSSSQSDQNIEINTNASLNMNQTDHHVTEGLDGYVTTAMPNSSETHVSNIEDVTTSSSGGNWIIDTTTEISVEVNQNSTTPSDNVAVSQISTSTTLAEGTSGSSIDIVEELTSSPPGEWNLGITTELTVDILNNDNTTGSSIMEGQGTNVAENTSIGTSVHMVEEVTSLSQGEQNIEILTDASVNINQTDHNFTEVLDSHITTAMPKSSETFVSNIEEVTFLSSLDFSKESTPKSEYDWDVDNTTSTKISVEAHNNKTKYNYTTSQTISTFSGEYTSTSRNVEIKEEVTSSLQSAQNVETISDSTSTSDFSPNKNISVDSNVLTSNGLCKAYGRYADFKNCHRFIVCATHRKPQVMECPAYTAYSSKMKYCTTDMSSCKHTEKFQCKKEGRFVDQGSCSSYYMCVKILPKTFDKYKLHCIRGMAFHPDLQMCVNSNSCFDKNTQESFSHSQDDRNKEQHDDIKSEGESEESKTNRKNISASSKQDLSKEKEKNTSDGNQQFNKNNFDENKNESNDDSNETQEKRESSNEYLKKSNTPNQSKEKHIHWSDRQKKYKKIRNENSEKEVKNYSESTDSTNSEQKTGKIYQESGNQNNVEKGRTPQGNGDDDISKRRHFDRARHGQKSSSSISKKESFECDDVGAYADPEDCSKYYVCIPKKSKFKIKHKKCGKKKIFDEVMGRCIWGDSETCL